MALNSTASQSTALVSWTPHLRAAPLRLTPIGRSWRASHRKPIYAPSIPRCFQLCLIFLCKDLRRLHLKFGHFAVRQRLYRNEWVRHLQLRSYRWRLRWKTYPLSLSSTARRMYWRTILPLSHRAEHFRLWMGYHRVQNRVKKMFQPSQRKTAHRKSGESNDIT